MKTKTLFAGSMVFAVLFAVAAIASRPSTGTTSEASPLAADFITQPAAEGTLESAASTETLVDWEFTLRGRPVKCRFF